MTSSFSRKKHFIGLILASEDMQLLLWRQTQWLVEVTHFHSNTLRSAVRFFNRFDEVVIWMSGIFIHE